MDYKRIYQSFIKDRRVKEAAPLGYTEKHHILPRSMGGSEDPENLIALTPEDHFFAHLCLAKINNTRGMWAAVMLMLGSKGAGAGRFTLRRKATKWRAAYGLIKRKNALLSVGINGANADLEKRTFYHFDGRTFTGTRIAFSEAYNISAPSIDQMVRGESTYCHGWSMSLDAAKSYLRARKRRAVKNGRALKGYTRDSNIYCFVEVSTGRCIIGTQRGMKEQGLLCRASVSALCTGSSYVRKGWCLIENIEWAEQRSKRCGIYSGAFDGGIHDFLNSITGERFTGTIWDAGQNIGSGDSRPFGELVRGYRNGFKGWHVASKTPPRKMNNLVRSIICQKTGQVFAGTNAEIANFLGVSRSAVSHLFSGTLSNVKGWVVDEEKPAIQVRAQHSMDRNLLQGAGG